MLLIKVIVVGLGFVQVYSKLSEAKIHSGCHSCRYKIFLSPLPKNHCTKHYIFLKAFPDVQV